MGETYTPINSFGKGYASQRVLGKMDMGKKMLKKTAS